MPNPIQAHLPWADLTSLAPHQVAFQQTHPAVRRQILGQLHAAGDWQGFKSLIGVHGAQSRTDRLRASQGRPSPYAPANQPQPWHHYLWSKTAAVTANVERPLTWDEVGMRHPTIYGDPEVHGDEADGADGEGIGWAAGNLAFDRPGPEYDEGPWDLDFHLKNVPVSQIDYARHGAGDSRVASARRWYRESPDEVVPPVLVHRHGVYQVADGHHRGEAAALEGKETIPAYVAQSPYENEPFSDGQRGPYHGAEVHPHDASEGEWWRFSAFNSDNEDPETRTPSWNEVGRANAADYDEPLTEWENAHPPNFAIDDRRVRAFPHGLVPYNYLPGGKGTEEGDKWPEESGRFPSMADLQQNVVQPMVGIKETGDPSDPTYGGHKDQAHWPGRPWGPGDDQGIDHSTGKPSHEMIFNPYVDEHGHRVDPGVDEEGFEVSPREREEYLRQLRHTAAVEGFLNPYHGNPEFEGNPDFSHTWFHGTKGDPNFGSTR